MKIKSFDNFINEKLGVLYGLDDISNLIINELSDKKYFKYKSRYLDKDITIHCFKVGNNKDIYQELSGSFCVDDASNFEFTIKLSNLSKRALIHELKHMDRAIRQSMKTDAYFYINHIGRYITKQYSHLFINKSSSETLIETFYYCNPDEFEAYYQDIYNEIKVQINDGMNRSQKIETIKKIIENENIYTFFKYFYNNKFKLENFFKSKEDCNFFIKEFFYRQELFYNQKDETISNFDRIKSIVYFTLIYKLRYEEEINFNC